MRILVLTSRVPFPPLGGDRLRLYNFVKSLGVRHEITLLALTDNPAEIDVEVPGATRTEVFYLPRFISYLKSLRGLFSAHPLQIHYYQSRKLKQRVRQLLREEAFDLIFVHLIRLAEYVEDVRDTPRILDLTDAISLNYERSRAFEKGRSVSWLSLAQKVERQRMRHYEAKVLDRFDINLIISEVDRNFLGRFANVQNVEIIGPGVDLDYFSYQVGAYDHRQIIFVGKMSTFPNKDAALYFYESILPLVLQRFPDLRYVIVGIEPPPEILALARHPHVKVFGHVPDIRPYLHQSALSICPMRTGAGAKNKVLEALAAGTPVVSTSMGIEGLDLQHEREVLIADDPEAFAAQVIRLIEDKTLRASLSRRGRLRMEQSYGWDVVLSRLHELIDSLYMKEKSKTDSSTRLVHA